MTATDLYTPPDILEAWETWKASCGPAALAAILRRPVMETRSLFPGWKGYCNYTHMIAALRLAGVPHPKVAQLGRGLAFIQFAGPWEEPGVPIAAAYRHTHWVGVDRGMIFDVNAGWLKRAEWEADVVPDLIDHNKGSTGWWVRYRIAVVNKKEQS